MFKEELAAKSRLCEVAPIAFVYWASDVMELGPQLWAECVTVHAPGPSAELTEG